MAQLILLGPKCKMLMQTNSADDKLQDEPCSSEQQCFGKVFCLQHVAFKANTEGVTNLESKLSNNLMQS